LILRRTPFLWGGWAISWPDLVTWGGVAVTLPGLPVTLSDLTVTLSDLTV
jgi:hypothetical protein